MKLSGTNRLGVVISILWVLSCSAIALYQMYGPFKSCESTFFTYLQNPELVGFIADQGGFDISTAIKVGETNCPPPGMERQLKLTSTMLIIFLPILASWVIVSVAILSYRWVRAGYASNGNST